MKYNKSPGEDGITTEALKIGESSLLPHITNLFNSILKTGCFPNNFCHSTIVLLHKKGDKSDIGNYRPISLISHLYKAFIKVIENRISANLDLHQPPEQAGFRRGLSTTDHLHSLNQIIEKHHEFRLPLYTAFVDYSKAFDSLTHSSLFNALIKQNINPTYVHILQNIYRNSTAAVKVNTIGPSFHITKGVKQGDPLSPKLFTATLEEVFRELASDWEEKGISVGGNKRLTNLRFADDIVLFSSSASELEEMLQDLNEASLKVGLSMNMSKTKLMTNNIEQRICIGDVEIEYVHEYVYLGQIVSFQARQDKEVARRTENAWKSYWALKNFMKGKLPMCLKRKLMDMCILPVLTYGAQTWSLTSQQRSTLEVCQRAMERSILGVKLIDRIRNTILRSRTQIADVTQTAAKLKWDWAGHVCRMPDEKWAKTTTDWIPQDIKRPRGRPRRRWKDELDAYLKDWSTIATDRNNWREGREAFAQQWDNMG